MGSPCLLRPYPQVVTLHLAIIVVMVWHSEFCHASLLLGNLLML